MSNSILVVASYPDSIVPFRGALIRAMLDRDYVVHVAAPGLDARSRTTGLLRDIGAVPHDIPLQRTGMNAISDLRTLVALMALMRRLRPAVVLSYTLKPIIYGSIAARLARVPRSVVLVTGLGYSFGSGSREILGRLVRLLLRLAVRRADPVFFQNRDDLELVRGLGLLPAGARTVLVNGSGVDLQEYSPRSEPASPASFLMVARLLGDKGVREYARAAAMVKRLHPDAIFRLAGWIDPGPDAISPTELDDWIANGTLEYLGKLEDVRPAIDAASVYVLPSYREGTPRTVLEAMAMARPIVTTAAPGCRETVVEGENGFLVPVRDSDALARAMVRFLDEPALLRRMAGKSREIALDKFDATRVAASMVEAMELP